MKRHAFTLIELLVVIAIIGLLTTIALMSFGSSRAKARDAKRLADLRQITTAINLYYENNGVYPTCAGSVDVCSTTGYLGDFTTLGINPSYMGNIPKDPTNISTSYGYYYARGWHPTGACGYSIHTTLATEYILATRLESPNGVAGSCSGVFAGWDNLNLNYLLGAP
jgi:prepilin-type N-terminal cleavage/methylation domain-containing protein